MIDENRVMTYFGLRQINNNPRPGLKALMSGFDLKDFCNSDVVFKIAPRINAAGRMVHGNFAVDLLMAENDEQTIKMAEQIEVFNTDRRALDQQITEEALTQILENDEIKHYSTVVYDPNWLKGVIGIVASRLTRNPTTDQRSFLLKVVSTSLRRPVQLKDSTYTVHLKLVAIQLFSLVAINMLLA